MHDIALIQTVGSVAKTMDEIHSVFDNTNALNMLNTKYIIYNPDEPPIVNRKAMGECMVC